MIHMLQKSLRIPKNDETTYHQEAEVMEPPPTIRFPYFSELSEDICGIIISFVADAPYELEVEAEVEAEVAGTQPHSYQPASLTTSLPLVNKAFYQFAHEDSYWRAALLRQVAHPERGRLWSGGLIRLLPSGQAVDPNTAILEQVQEYLGSDMITHQEIYKAICTRHIKFEAPIFMMPSPVQLGERYGLHLFEPRYRMMVRDLLSTTENPEESRNGGRIRPGRSSDGVVLQPPHVIHFCLPQRMRTGALACLVEVVYCQTYEQETADVQLFPIAWVRLEDVWVRPSYGNLFYAKATRIV